MAFEIFRFIYKKVTKVTNFSNILDSKKCLLVRIRSGVQETFNLKKIGCVALKQPELALSFIGMDSTIINYNKRRL